MGAVPLTTVPAVREAHGIDGSRGVKATAPATEIARSPGGYKFRNDNDQTDLIHWAGLHEGKGTVDIKLFFRADRAPNPALLLLYTIPPGASEGVHTHNPGDAKSGSFDEFYYILKGNGEMQIDGQKIPVKPGDHVFTPNGIAHGIENTSSQCDLKVYLVAMIRD